MAKKKQTTKTVEPPKDDPDDPLNNALRIGAEGTELKRLTCVTDLLNDESSLVTLAETVASGGSIATAEMRMGLPPGMLKGWIRNGRAEKEGAFNALYHFYMHAAAAAKHAAEASLLKKNPSAWLDKYDPLKQLEQSPDEPVVIETKAKPQNTVTYKEFPE